MSSLIPLSGEGILQEHIQRRNTHLCSVFFHSFRCVNPPSPPRKSAGSSKPQGSSVRLSASLFLREAAPQCDPCGSVRGGSYQVKSPRSQQELCAIYPLPPPPPPPPAHRAHRRPMRHSRHALLTHASQNFSTQRLGCPGNPDLRNECLNKEKEKRKKETAGTRLF